MNVVIELGAALICFMGQCYPALVGDSTPTGEYEFTYYSTETPGYGGSILVFKENENEVWGVHKVINVPGQNRKERLSAGTSDERKSITAGCVNVTPEVYYQLIDCCSNSKVIVK